MNQPLSVEERVAFAAITAPHVSEMRELEARTLHPAGDGAPPRAPRQAPPRGDDFAEELPTTLEKVAIVGALALVGISAAATGYGLYWIGREAFRLFARTVGGLDV